MIIDDDPDLQLLLKRLFTLENLSVVLFSTGLHALVEIEARKRNNKLISDLIICDLKLPDLDGLEFIVRMKSLNILTPIILITAHGSIKTAVEAVKKGAFDYIIKPINLAELILIAKRAIQFDHCDKNRTTPRSSLKMIGKSLKIRQIFDLIERVARSVSNVLITGESGTGKEMVARAIHEQSARSLMPFIALNCSSIPEHLLESELFGHKKGAFTGAQDARRGLFEEANKGTIFLDEIGDMPLELQSKLLRVIQEREIKPIGENRPKRIDVRIIAATHKDLRTQINEGKFREDLYFRLCVIPIQLPSLRERKEDIPLLADFFIKKYCNLNDTEEKKFSEAAMSKLIHEKWPGNVRELENTIERAVVLSTQLMIDDKDIQIESGIVLQQCTQDLFSKLPTLDELEKEYVQYVLSYTERSKEKAASILGINRKTLYRKEHG